MGVAGSGKSFIGTRLAEALGWKFDEGDEFHPEENRRKMERGIPLDDDDRRPWLERLRRHIDGRLGCGENAIVACSALRESYRKALGTDRTEVRVVYLEGSKELIRERLRRRRGHFFPETLLESQFQTLEVPADAVRVDVSLSPDEIVTRIRQALGV